jgi:predicted permease
MMTTWLADLRFGFRMLLKTPLLSVVAVVTVALGVGLTTHTFSSVYGTIVRGVPVPGHERLTYIGASRLDLGISQMELSVHDFEDLRAQQTSFEDVAAFDQGTVNIAGDEGPPERFAGAYVSDNFFAHLGVAPLLGRAFRAGEDDPDAAIVIVVGYHVWQNRFAGEPDIVGRSIRVNGQTAEIIGVMPEGFRFPFLEDVWLTHRIDVPSLSRGAGQDLDAFARLKEGVSMEQARAELEAVGARLASTFPESNEGVAFTVSPYEERFMPQEIQAVLWVMLVATFGVLLIACANVANLLMARASIRSREIAIRTAMGAGRWRVIRQLLMEAAVLAALGGALGVVLAYVGLDAYRNAIADIYKPYWIDFGLDVPTLLFSLGVTGVAAIAAGILPAIRATGVSIGEHLKDETRGSTGLRLGRLSTALVVSEIAVSCALLVGAGFMIRSIVNLKNVDLGFEVAGVMTGRVGLFEADYPDEASRQQFFERLKQRLEAEPGVLSASLGTSLPGLGGPRYFWSVAGAVYATDRDHPVVTTTVVAPDYFGTFGVELRRGRDFVAAEAVPGADPVAIVNESFAETYLAGTPVLGEQIRLGRSESTRPWRRVIGVVPDMHVGGNVGGIGDDQVRPERIFLPLGALDVSFMSLAVRTRDDPAGMAPVLRDLVQELDPNLPVYDLLPLGQAVRDATWAFALFGTLFTIFGAAALFLAAVGLYGVMAFSVSQRRQEMGIRMALGAEPQAILAMIMTRGARQLAIGMTVGLALGAIMSRSMSVVLYGVQVADPLVDGSIVATLAGSGLLACLLPARSATRTDPLQAMRGE